MPVVPAKATYRTKPDATLAIPNNVQTDLVSADTSDVPAVEDGRQPVLSWEREGKPDCKGYEKGYGSLSGEPADSTLSVEENGSHVKLPEGVYRKIAWCAGKICYRRQLVNACPPFPTKTA